MDANPGPRQAPTWERSDPRKDMINLWAKPQDYRQGKALNEVGDHTVTMKADFPVIYLFIYAHAPHSPRMEVREQGSGVSFLLPSLCGS